MRLPRPRAALAIALACIPAVGMGGCCGPLLIPPFGLLDTDCGHVDLDVSTSPASPEVNQRTRITAALSTAHPGTPVFSPPPPMFTIDGPAPAILDEWPGIVQGNTYRETHRFTTPGVYAVKASGPTALADSTPTYAHEVYTSIGEHTFQVRGPGAEPNEQPVAVIDAPPVVAAGSPVTFDASRSSDPEGLPLANYRWDFGDGSLPIDTGTPTRAHTFEAPGTFTVVLVVTDAGGLTGATERAITVVPPDELPPGRAAPDSDSQRSLARASAATDPAAKPGRRVRATLTGVRLGALPKVRTAGDQRFLKGQRVRGQLRGRRLGSKRGRRQSALLRGLLRARWRGRLSASVDLAGQRATNTTVALARFRGLPRSRACVRVRVRQRAGQAPRASLAVLGGTGGAAKLRARASFEVLELSQDRVRLAGRIRARSGAERGLPRPCRALRRG